MKKTNLFIQAGQVVVQNGINTLKVSMVIGGSLMLIGAFLPKKEEEVAEETIEE